MRRASDPPLLTDYGETLRWLRAQTPAQRRSERQQQILLDACDNHGVWLRRGELVTLAASGEALAAALVRLGQACLRVADLSYTLRPRHSPSVADEVSAFLLAHLQTRPLDLTRDERVEGISATTWHIDLRLRLPDRQVLVFLLATESRAQARKHAEHIVAACSDLAHLRKLRRRPVEFVALFDDRTAAWSDAEARLVTPFAAARRWSERDAWVAELDATDLPLDDDPDSVKEQARTAPDTTDDEPDASEDDFEPDASLAADDDESEPDASLADPDDDESDDDDPDDDESDASLADLDDIDHDEPDASLAVPDAIEDDESDTSLAGHDDIDDDESDTSLADPDDIDDDVPVASPADHDDIDDDESGTSLADHDDIDDDEPDAFLTQPGTPDADESAPDALLASSSPDELEDDEPSHDTVLADHDDIDDSPHLADPDALADESAPDPVLAGSEALDDGVRRSLDPSRGTDITSDADASTARPASDLTEEADDEPTTTHRAHPTFDPPGREDAPTAAARRSRGSPRAAARRATDLTESAGDAATPRRARRSRPLAEDHARRTLDLPGPDVEPDRAHSRPASDLTEEAGDEPTTTHRARRSLGRPEDTSDVRRALDLPGRGDTPGAAVEPNRADARRASDQPGSDSTHAEPPAPDDPDADDLPAWDDLPDAPPDAPWDDIDPSSPVPADIPADADDHDPFAAVDEDDALGMYAASELAALRRRKRD